MEKRQKKIKKVKKDEMKKIKGGADKLGERKSIANLRENMYYDRAKERGFGL